MYTKEGKKMVKVSPVVRGLKFHHYAQKIPQGELWSRADFARVFGVHYTTAQYHVERAVEQGLLNRCLGWIEDKPGYLYAKPETMPNLPGVR
jgi:hypothetical protein